MQSFKIIALLLLTDSGGYVKFTLKYIIVQGEGGYWDFFKYSKFILLVIEEVMQSFKTIALILLTDSGGYVKFTLKYIIVGDSGNRFF